MRHIPRRMLVGTGEVVCAGVGQWPGTEVKEMKTKFSVISQNPNSLSSRSKSLEMAPTRPQPLM